MATRKITRGVSVAEVDGEDLSGNPKSIAGENDYDGVEARKREEILYKLSQNSITSEIARIAWIQSFERELRLVKKNLDAVEQALGCKPRTKKM